MLEKCDFILVSTSHPGNIGAAARAISNMGFGRLVLVSPIADHLSEDSLARAANAKDILKEAKVYNTLQEAVVGSTLVFATRGRKNSLKWQESTPKAAAIHTREHIESSKDAKVSFVFGQEQSGLSNELLEISDAHIVIPTGEYASLNLAQAVQVIAYEIFVALNDKNIESTRLSNDKEEPATHGQVDGFFQQLEEVMISLKFLDPEKPKKLMPRLKSLFSRAKLSVNEVQILRGFLTAINNRD